MMLMVMGIPSAGRPVMPARAASPYGLRVSGSQSSTATAVVDHHDHTHFTGQTHMRKRWTAAGMLDAEQQFRRIIGYRDLAKLVIAIERHTLAPSPQNPQRQEAPEPVTV
jgi:hypothetical protein